MTKLYVSKLAGMIFLMIVLGVLGCKPAADGGAESVRMQIPKVQQQHDGASISATPLPGDIAAEGPQPTLEPARPPINITGAMLTCLSVAPTVEAPTAETDKENYNYGCKITDDKEQVLPIASLEVANIKINQSDKTEAKVISDFEVVSTDEGTTLLFRIDDETYAVPFTVTASITAESNQAAIQNNPQRDYIRRFWVLCNRLVGQDEATTELAAFGCAIVKADGYALWAEDIHVVTDWQIGFHNPGIVQPIPGENITPYANSSEWHMRFNLNKAVLSETEAHSYIVSCKIDGVPVSYDAVLYPQETKMVYTQEFYDNVIGEAWGYEEGLGLTSFRGKPKRRSGGLHP